MSTVLIENKKPILGIGKSIEFHCLEHHLRKNDQNGRHRVNILRVTRVNQSAGRPTAVGGRNSRGQPWTAMMAVDGRDGCGRPRTTVAAVDGNEQLVTAVDGSDGCGRMPAAVDNRGRP